VAVSETELAFRRRWYEAHRDRLKADGEQYRHRMEEVDGFVESASEALELLDDLRRTGDTASFVQNMRKWAVKPGTLAFNGHSGQKMLHQLEDRANSPRDLATLLGDALDTPSSDDEAAS